MFTSHNSRPTKLIYPTARFIKEEIIPHDQRPSLTHPGISSIRPLCYELISM